ncbi:MAG TPA: Gfo/Idh/MocA family oxidoreductase [Verrucomicrobiota bacterium]|jgi:predicted dehydrogenase|nr:Gfo/Idh/MocA family oxidoreductase [Verrucomicrobiota bacterium]HRT07642.1 Gfo/Idh/MocA family oxidoreductase [Candidatus Paceibacterota bacterium]HRT56312.1 Gfo/Idh/MocA family oxidoreductase [Candidatus Paceibacterota bacterium]
MKKKIRLGLIGAGSVVREIYQHLYFRSQYSELLEICAVADPNEECRNWFGDLAGLPASRRYADYRELLDQVELDAVQVNTPDHLHAAPTVAALKAGLDVVVPKPTAATVKDAHAMIQAAREHGRILAVDFHKREDPRIKEAEARYQSGRYGTLQAAVFYMLDKLFVADPNHTPRFFASPDFAARNTPISFLTVHMADALMKIVNLIPVQVRAIGYAHKLPSLKPQPVHGYDLVDTEILFDSGAVAHILTGWAVPNTAWSTTVQSGRLICSDGLLDLGLDTPGLLEIHADGVLQVNPLFRNFEKDQTVTGYGITHPGRLYRQMLASRSGTLSAAERESLFTPMALGFYTTLVLEGAERSLAAGKSAAAGVTVGPATDLRELVVQQLGKGAAREYGLA